MIEGRREFLETAALVGVALTAPQWLTGCAGRKDQEIQYMKAVLAAQAKQVATKEAQITALGLSSTPGVDETLEAVARAAGAPTPTIPVSTEAGATLDRQAERREWLSSTEVSPWDAGASLPANPNVINIMAWYVRVTQDHTCGILGLGDVRTYDQIREIAGEDAIFWWAKNPEAYENRFGNKVWVSQHADRSFPQAKEANSVLKENVRAWVNCLGGSVEEADHLFRTLRSQLFAPGPNGRLDVRTTYPEQGGSREDQPEFERCDVAYIDGIDVGKECVRNGVLCLSNKAKVGFVFVRSATKLPVDDPKRLASVSFGGETLNVRMFDFESKPDPRLFGDYGLKVKEESDGGSGHQILPPCSLAATQTPVPPQPTATATQKVEEKGEEEEKKKKKKKKKKKEPTPIPKQK